MPGQTKGAATSSRLVEAMLSLVQSRGYEGTGINAVLEAAKAPRGSFYFHFPGGKEELAEQAVQLATDQYRAVIAAAAETGGSPAEVVGGLLDVIEHLLVGADFAVGCPVAVVTLEAGSHSERLRQACESAYAAWIAVVRDYLGGQGLDADEATALAETLVSTVEGAMILSRARRDVGPLRSARHVLTGLLDARFARPEVRR